MFGIGIPELIILVIVLAGIIFAISSTRRKRIQVQNTEKIQNTEEISNEENNVVAESENEKPKGVIFISWIIIVYSILVSCQA